MAFYRRVTFPVKIKIERNEHEQEPRDTKKHIESNAIVAGEERLFTEREVLFTHRERLILLVELCGQRIVFIRCDRSGDPDDAGNVLRCTKRNIFDWRQTGQ